MMNRRQLSPGRQFTTLPAAMFDDRVTRRGRWRSIWSALGPLAFGMVLALGASPAAALSPTEPATGFGGSSSVSPVERELPVNDLDAAERLTALRERHLELHALADAEAAFRGALAIVESARGPADPQMSDSLTALGDVWSWMAQRRSAMRWHLALLLAASFAASPVDGVAGGKQIVDVKELAGSWRGWVRAESGRERATMVVEEDGTYKASTTRGTLTEGMFYLRDGELRYRSTRTTGTASLSEGQGKTILTMMPVDPTADTGRTEYERLK